MYVFQVSARAELWQTKVLVVTFETCARLHKCAPLCASVRSLCALGLTSIKVIGSVMAVCCYRNALVSEIIARGTCLHVFRQKPVPKMNARLKIQEWINDGTFHTRPFLLQCKTNTGMRDAPVS